MDSGQVGEHSEHCHDARKAAERDRGEVMPF
jgi:hypothetical protein